jgi:hypothetical protein
VLDVARNLAHSLCSNYPEFPDSCLSAQLALVEEVHEVLVDRPNILLEQLGDLGLGEPKRLALEAALEARSPVLGLIEEELRGRLGSVAGASWVHGRRSYRRRASPATACWRLSRPGLDSGGLGYSRWCVTPGDP